MSVPWWVVIIILVVAYIAMIQIRLPYTTKPITAYGVTCNNSQVTYPNLMGLGSMAIAMHCIEYKSSGCKPVCVNNQPSCECVASIWDQLFSRPGEWVWDAMAR
jgi:hypothetical protein